MLSFDPPVANFIAYAVAASLKARGGRDEDRSSHDVVKETRGCGCPLFGAPRWSSRNRRAWTPYLVHTLVEHEGEVTQFALLVRGTPGCYIVLEVGFHPGGLQGQ